MNSYIMENSISGKRLVMKLSAWDKVIPGYILGFRIPRTGFQPLSVELGIRIPIVSGIPYSKPRTLDSWLPSLTWGDLHGYWNGTKLIFNNYSSSPSGRPHGYWLRGHSGSRNNCVSKIQLAGQKYWDKTTLACKTRFSRYCFGFPSRCFSLLLGYNI